MDEKYFHAIRHTITVRVKQGNLVGSIKEGVFGAVYKAFLGVPYAAPPLDQLRFKDPQPPVCWQDDRVVTDDFCFMSAQLCRESMKNVIGSEDCLYLNVYVPYEEHPQASYKAVMVWIHGGDFCYGSGDYSDIRPDYFMKKDVILVTVNYRLGVLGFLNLGQEEASGNQGLKDQIAALKWIKENIFNFGGDANNITIFGNGAGAISAHLLMISPLSKNLFKKAILQSGVALCNWAIRENQSEGFTLANSMGCSSTDSKVVLDFLRKIPYRVLIMAESNIISKKERSIKKVIFGPTIDTKSPNPFLPCPVSELLDNGNDIPILIGHNTEEILGSYPEMIDGEILKDEDLKTYVELFAGQHNSDKIPQYTKQILKHYGNTSSLQTWHSHLIRLCLSDLYYNLAIRSVVIKRVKVKQQKAKTYFYIYSYNGSEKKLNEDLFTEQSGTSHGDELIYMFYMPRYRKDNFFAMMRKDYDIINMITHIWSNFARTGNPNFSCKDGYSQWDPVESENDITCFEINRQPSGWINERNYLILTNKWY